MSKLINNEAENRYEMLVDGHVSIADYYKKSNNIAITHVEVPPEIRGLGVAAKLMEAILNDAREKGLTITPVCSYAVSYMQRHPQN